MQSMTYTPTAGQPMPWYEVWMEVISHPSRDSFRRILADPTASPTRAFIWVGILGLIFGIIQVILTEAFGASLSGELGVSKLFGMGFAVFCVAIFVPVAAIIGLALSAAIYHGIAKLMHGQGTYNSLLYCMGAVQAPVSIFSYLISFISLLASGGSFTTAGTNIGTLASLCVLPFSLAAGIYTIVLEVLAIDTVENIGTGKAVLTVLIPVIVAFLLGACIFSAIIATTAGTYFNR